MIRVIGNRGFYIAPTFGDSECDYTLWSRPVNPKTGKLWQAAKAEARFKGERAKAKAAWALCKLK